MQIDWLAVIAMVLIIEGIMPLLLPKIWQGYIRKLAAEPIHHIRQVGGVLFAIGVILLYLR